MGQVLREVLDDLGLKDADLVKGAGVPFTTVWDWATESVDCQKTDETMFKVWMFLNKKYEARNKRLPLEYLIYGIGEIEELDNEDQPA